MTASSNRRLEGTYVVLRPIVPADAELTLAWRSGDRARLLKEGARTVEEQAAWIAARPAQDRNYIIELRSGAPVGMLSLIDIDMTHRHAETAHFLIGDEAAVAGIPVALEAMKLLYGLAFDQLGLARIYGTVAAENRLMIKWQKFLGMKEEGRLRQHVFLLGRFMDVICLGMLEDEYRSVALPRMNALIRSATR